MILSPLRLHSGRYHPLAIALVSFATTVALILTAPGAGLA